MEKIFDITAIRAAHIRAARLNGDRFLDAAAVDGLADRLAVVTRKFPRGLLVGDAVPDVIAPFAQDWTLARFDDQERLVADGPFDLAVSIFSLQTINDLPGALVQLRRLLKPDGLFVGALLGGSTLGELRDSFAAAELATRGGISPRISPFADVRDMGGLLQRAGFALPVADVERLTVRYGDFFSLVRDLRAHGFTNTLTQRSRQALRRDTLATLLAHYRDHHSEDGKILARFETLYLTGWTPHESQQQPLKPGSAKTRLADALGVNEQKLSSDA